MKSLVFVFIFSNILINVFGQSESEEFNLRFQFRVSTLNALDASPDYLKQGAGVGTGILAGPLNRNGTYYPHLKTYAGFTTGSAWMGEDAMVGQEDSVHFMFSMVHVRLPYVAPSFRVELGAEIFRPFLTASVGIGQIKGEQWLDISNTTGSEMVTHYIAHHSTYLETGMGVLIGKGGTFFELSYTHRSWGKMELIDGDSVYPDVYNLEYSLKKYSSSSGSWSFGLVKRLYKR